VPIHTCDRELGLNPSDADAVSFHGLMQGQLDAYDLVDDMVAPLPEVKYPRTPGVRPQPEDNPYGAWAVKTRIQGARRGKLTGKRVAIKDNVCVAGVPMMNGASILEGYVWEIDATIVTRILERRGYSRQVGLRVLLRLRRQSHVSQRRCRESSCAGSQRGRFVVGLDRSGNGKSSGYGDRRRQGGSIRIPASYCGAVGLKPTHGLVPYTGIFVVELTVDHGGPITRTVADNALMLEVMAGPDDLDPRQSGAPAEPYTQALAKCVAGLRIVVCQDWGGPTGLLFAMSNPGRIRAFTVMSTWAWPLPPAEFHTRIFPWRMMHAPLVGPYFLGRHKALGGPWRLSFGRRSREICPHGAGGLRGRTTGPCNAATDMGLAPLDSLGSGRAGL
jgi:amidase